MANLTIPIRAQTNVRDGKNFIGHMDWQTSAFKHNNNQLPVKQDFKGKTKITEAGETFMLTKQLKVTAAIITLIGGIAGTPEALATNTGLQSLGDSSANVDVFTFTCPADTGARAKVNDLAFPNPPGVHILLVLGHDGTPTRQMLDDTDDGNPSAWTPIIPEPGAYAVVFKKTGTAAESYSGVVQCCYDANTCQNPALTKRIDQ